MEDAGSLVKKGFILLSLLSLVIFAGCSGGGAALKQNDASMAKLVKVDVVDSDTSTTVVLVLDKPASFTAVRLPDPPKMMVDLAGVSLGENRESVKVDKGPVSYITPSTVPDAHRIARLEIGLSRAANYVSTQDGSTIRIMFEKREAEAAPEALPIPGASVVQEAAKAPAEAPPAPAKNIQVADTAKEASRGEKAAAKKDANEKKAIIVEALPPAKAPAVIAPTATSPTPKPVVAAAVVLPRAKSVTSIGVKKSGNGYAVSIDGDGSLARPEVFRLGSDRLVVDLPGMTSLKDKETIEVGGRPLGRVRMARHKEAPGKVRIVLDLSGTFDYDVSGDGKTLLVTVFPPGGKAAQKEVAPAKPEAVSKPDSSLKADAKAKEVRAETPVMAAAIPKPADKPTAAAIPKPADKPTAAAIPKPADKPTAAAVPKPADKPTAAAIPKPADKPSADAVPKPADKPTAAAIPKPADKPTATAIPEPAIKPTAEPVSRQASAVKATSPVNLYISTMGGKTVLSSSPIEPAAAAKSDAAANGFVETPTKIYTGGKISFDIQDADLDKVMKLLADVAGLNLIMDPAEVRGKVTLKLDNVPWDQALDILLKIYNLDKVIEGNVLRIASKAKLDDERKRDLLAITEQKKLEQQAEDLYTKTFKINYTPAADLEPKVKKILSPRGDATANVRTNELIVTDIKESIEKAGHLIAILDKEVHQIMIEARIITVDVGYSRSLGVSWGLTRNADGSGGPNFTINGGNTPVGAAPTAGAPGMADTFKLNVPTALQAAAGGLLGGFSWGLLKEVNLDLTIEALETINRAETLSAPKLMTLENQAATIASGTTIYVQTTSAAGTAPQPLNANLSLTVTSRVTGDNFIMMEVTATKNSPAAVPPGAAAAIDTNSVTTNVLVKDGETVVLGGVFLKSKDMTESRVPILGKIPLLGWLFKNKTYSEPQNELMIFITPKLVRQSLAQV